MNVEQVHTSIRCVTRSLSAFLLASFRVLKKIVGVDACVAGGREDESLGPCILDG